MVELLSLSEGMRATSSAQASRDGTFQLQVGSASSSPRFLLRVIYKGANYNLSVAPEEAGTPVEIRIFEPTSEFKGIKGSMPLMLAQASGNALLIQQQYFLRNETSPPRTLINPGGTFFFDTPPASQVQDLNVSLLGMAGIALPQTPTPRPGGGYAIDYPMKPGMNEVRVSYRVNYPNDIRSFRLRLFYGAVSSKILILPAELKVEGPMLKVAGTDQRTGAAAYGVVDLPRDGYFEMKISGAAPEITEEGGSATASSPAQSEEQVVRIPSRVYGKRFIILGSLGLLFLLVILFVLQQHYSDGRKSPATSGKNSR
jgi:hypothetical protein